MRRLNLELGKPLGAQPVPRCMVRFLEKIVIGPVPPLNPEIHTPCWLWQGRCDVNGYGEFKWRGKKVIAHRFAWTAFRGPIPDGFDIDHLCFVHGCQNPDHLDPKSRLENSSRQPTRERERWGGLCRRGRVRRTMGFRFRK